MSKRNRSPQQAGIPPQEKTMPEQSETAVSVEAAAAMIEPSTKEANEQAPEPTVEQGPTAKEMALAEEQNAARQRALIEQAAAAAVPEPETPIVSLAAQGMDVLHAAILERSNQVVKEYVPPPRTERQMTQLQAELEAGARAQQRAEAQQQLANEARARAAAEERAKEGFTTPVYRPNDMVPDPIKGGMGPITQ